MLLDAHCHLQHCYPDKSFLTQTAETASKMSYLVDISTNIKEILNIVNNPLPANVLSAFGLYPEFAREFNQELNDRFIKLLKKHKPSAIGEVGIDFHWDYGNIEIQEKLFRNQIELSIESDIPLIIHSRDAFEDTYRILSGYQFNKSVILHCFGYGPAEAEKFLHKGFVISFAGNLTYKAAKDLHETALMAPIDRILLETDAPYLTPVPLRGQKNDPKNIRYTYEFMANLRKMDLNELEEQIERNFKRIFGLE
jgi:TatD DNase family protein